MGKKLVALDMDGTLLDSAKQLPSDFIPWVKEHPDVQIVIASGRQYFALIKMFEEVSKQLIFLCDNGGFVFEKGEVVYQNVIRNDKLRKCLEYLGAFQNVTVFFCGAKAAYLCQADEDVYQEASHYYEKLVTVDDLMSCTKEDAIVKVAVYVKGNTAEELYHQFPDMGGDMSVVLSGTDWIDISNSTSSKGDAIRMLQERLGISRENSYAFGDYLNDYTLLQACEESYAMSNGHPELIAVAKYTAPSNDENGVMKVLHELWG